MVGFEVWGDELAVVMFGCGCMVGHGYDQAV